MTHPLTPRENVELKPCPFCGGEAVAGSNFDNDHYVMCGADCDRCGGMVGYMKTEMAAIENWNRRTALASGSGDHAELARLAEAAKRVRRDSQGNLDGADAYRRWEAFTAAANPATVLALLAEIAALRAESESARTVVAWANNSLFGSCGYFHGDPYDGLHLARPIEALKDRATEAERKLAEAVGLLRDLASWFDGSAYNGAWVIRSGDLGVDDAICAARTFLSKEAERG